MKEDYSFDYVNSVVDLIFTYVLYYNINTYIIKEVMHMKKIMMGMITGFMIFVFCAGCSSTTNDNSSNALIVEDGMIKYSNNGKLEEVIA